MCLNLYNSLELNWIMFPKKRSNSLIICLQPWLLKPAANMPCRTLLMGACPVFTEILPFFDVEGKNG